MSEIFNEIFGGVGSSGNGGGNNANNKGWFATPLALRTAYPVGQNGWFAVVGSTDTVWVWDADTTDWLDTQTSQSVTSVFDRTGDIEAESGDYNASQVDYDNSTSGLDAENVQDAIDEVVADITAVRSDLTETSRTTKVSLTGNNSNDGVNKPYRNIQTALDNGSFGWGVTVDIGGFSESLIFNDVALNGKYSNRFLYGNASTGSFPTVVSGGVTVQGFTTRCRIRDLQFNGKLTIDGAQGRHYFDNVYFGGGIETLGNIQRWSDFRRCSAAGVISLGESGTPVAGTVFLFEDCDFSTVTDFRIGHQNISVVFRNCRRLPRKITHLKGNLRFQSQNNIESAISSTNWLESTCNSGEGTLIIDKGFSTRQNNGAFARINKTGTCPVSFGSIERDYINDVINGTVTYLKDTYIQNIQDFLQPIEVPFTNTTTVTVTHNLGRKPIIQVLDSNNAIINSTYIRHTSINEFIMENSVASTGMIFYY